MITLLRVRYDIDYDSAMIKYMFVDVRITILRRYMYELNTVFGSVIESKEFNMSYTVSLGFKNER